MKTTIKMPRVSDTVDEVLVVEWMVGAGDVIEAGATIISVDADKAVVEVPSPVAGTVLELLVEVDDEVTTGSPIIVVEM
ncbi:MAG: biotin/lipoyl-containing protein [Actinomycetota bacterium]